ncbi:MAG: hypothetical protein Q4A54_03830, partial [Parabacteroides sp.]|nr:hypothetical protein [Parabacteroides sp.]
MKRIFYILILIFCSIISVWAEGSRYASQSVLHSGKWVKIQVEENGIYKLTSAELKKMGFSDISKVAVYGYGGWPLDENFSTPYIDDLPEIAVWRDADYLLFYGKGPIKWEYSFSSSRFEHTNNPYSNKGYYFLTEKESVARTMESVASVEGATLQVTTFDDYLLHEQELVSINASGRELYGESFETTLSRDFTFTVPGITEEEGKVALSFVARPKGSSGRVTMSVNEHQLIASQISTVSDSYLKAREVNRTANWSGEKEEKLKVNIQYNTTGHENVRLNYFILQMKRQLKVYNSCTFFRSLSSRG